MCSRAQSFTDRMSVNCSTNHDLESTCTYQWQDPDAFSLVVPNGSLYGNMRFNTKNTDPFFSFPRLQDRMVPVPYPVGGGTGYAMAFLRKQDNSQYFGTGPYPKIDLVVAYWEWCAETYNSTDYMPNGDAILPATNERLFGPTSSSDNDTNEYLANSTGMHYEVSLSVERWIATGFLDYMGAKIISYINEKGTIVSEANEDNADDAIGPYLSKTDIEKMASNVARTISNLIRSLPGNGGHNTNTTSIAGQAWGQETYIHVRWQWLTLALLETILSAVFLLTTIILDRRSGNPLLKSSALGLLFHGLEGWAPGDLRDHVKGVETANKLEAVARKMEVRFTTNDDGRLRFVRSR